jgi:hypothetical protein
MISLIWVGKLSFHRIGRHAGAGKGSQFFLAKKELQMALKWSNLREEEGGQHVLSMSVSVSCFRLRSFSWGAGSTQPSK